MIRALKGNDSVVRFQFFTGSKTVAPTGTPTLTVERADGTALTSPTVSVSTSHKGLAEATLTAADHTDELDRLKLTWSGIVEGRTVLESYYVDVVGTRYFQLHELRAMQGLASYQAHTDEALEFARTACEARFESYCETAFAPRYVRETGDALEFFQGPFNSLTARRLPARALREVSLNGTAQDITGWTLSAYGLVRPVETWTSPDDWAWAGQDLTLAYEYGHEAPEPDLKRAALRYARHIALTETATIPERTRMMQTNEGIYTFEAASKENPTGINEVDAVLMDYSSDNGATFA